MSTTALVATIIDAYLLGKEIGVDDVAACLARLKSTALNSHLHQAGITDGMALDDETALMPLLRLRVQLTLGPDPDAAVILSLMWLIQLNAAIQTYIKGEITEVDLENTYLSLLHDAPDPQVKTLARRLGFSLSLAVSPVREQDRISRIDVIRASIETRNSIHSYWRAILQ